MGNRAVQKKKKLKRQEQRDGSTEHFGEIVEALPHLVCRIAADGKIEYVNPAFGSFFGREAGRLVGEDLAGLWSGRDLGSLRELLEGAPSGEPKSFDSFIPNAAGDERHIRWTLFGGHVRDGRALAVQLFGEDVTALRHAGRALVESEQRLRSVTEGSPDCIMLLDAGGRVELINRAAPWMKPQDVVGKSLYELVDAGRGAAIEACVRRVLKTGEPDTFVSEYHHPDGGQRTFEFRVGPVVQDGKGIGLCLVTTDVTERSETEKAIRESEARWRSLLDRFPQGVGMIVDGKIEYSNPALHELLGYAPEEFHHRSPADFLVPSERQRAVERIDALVTSAPEYPSEYRLVRKDGQLVPVEILSRTIEYGGRSALLSVFRDLTDIKRAEDERKLLEMQVQHAQKLESLGVLAGGIAHDFNNLLTGILGNASLARISLDESSRVGNAIARIESSALRAAELTNQMLAYSGRGKFVVESIDMSPLVEEMLQLLEASISKKTSIVSHLDPNLPPIEGDATQVRQVVMNLVTNASESYAGEPGRVEVSTGVLDVSNAYLAEVQYAGHAESGTYVHFTVADQGAGMDKTTRTKIFDPFFTTKFTGRGLGLAAVLGIVRGHGGAIRVDSHPGEGTSFRVLLPVGSRAPKAIAPRMPPLNNERRSGTVLVVDDEEIVRAVATAALEELGYSVLTAADGQEAVRIFGEHHGRINVVLLDMSMPLMSGEETLVEIRRIRADIRVILTSGYDEEQAAALCRGDSATRFIQKPFRPAELASLLVE